MRTPSPRASTPPGASIRESVRAWKMVSDGACLVRGALDKLQSFSASSGQKVAEVRLGLWGTRRCVFWSDTTFCVDLRLFCGPCLAG